MEIQKEIRELRKKIKILEEKKKALIIEYNKECDSDERIRGTTPPQIYNFKMRSLSPSPSPLPKSRITQSNTKNMTNINEYLKNEKITKLIEKAMEKKLNVLMIK